MDEKMKPKYNILQNVGFMLRMAWKYQKAVVPLCLCVAAVSVGLSLVQLFIGPEVLRQVEQHAPLSRLLGTIGIFSAALLLLQGLKEYLSANVMFGRIDVRGRILIALSRKASTTSYPNVFDPDVLALQEKAGSTLNSNEKASEHIWTTLTDLTINLAGFGIYLLLLSGLNPFLMLVVIVTTAAGFFFTRKINGWGYRHREEEGRYEGRLWYIQERSEEASLAKDIRIFGLSGWLEQIYDAVMRLYEDFFTRREKVYIRADLIDLLLSFARNGIAYFYLIRLTLRQGLPASDFLLYFTAVSGFTAWVTGILSQFSQLHRESIELSSVQEYLNLPEPFIFEGGASIPPAEGWELKLENVTFRYPGSDQDIIRGMNLTIHPGEKLAIVGLNGAGKTTLVKLLCGFYDPDEGRVLLNGMDIRSFNRREYYGLLSAVF